MTKLRQQMNLVCTQEILPPRTFKAAPDADRGLVCAENLNSAILVMKTAENRS